MLRGIESPELSSKTERAVEIIRRSKGVVVALSAGVDSSLVAFIAHATLGDRSIAATAASESLSPGELETAKRIADEIGIGHVIVRTHELEDPNYSANGSNRCFYCKETLYKELRLIADKHGMMAILDGTQLDDLSDDRPGLQAALQAGVISPLLLAGFRKRDVREAARALGLSVWDKPAMPCLSSRIAHGETVTEQKLSMVGEAEDFIRSLTGVSELRVRYHTGLARIEVGPDERNLFFNEAVMDTISQKLLSLGFSSVTLDLRGYRSKAEPATAENRFALPIVNS
ncbi:TIGR00268 family protein [archaeon 13_1_20CM_2_54_9]|nr:MAG: TIGR00268 family protein [archaeon 13_1_20CM_2_54_9]